MGSKVELNEDSSRLGRLFTTVKEQAFPVQTTITGSVPQWIDGNLVRTGPGIFEVNGHKFNHLFDGMTILHKFSIQNGNVTYQSKYLRGDTYTENMAQQRITVAEFGTVASPDPCDSLYRRFMARFTTSPEKITDTCNVNILPFKNDECYVASETPHLRKIDPKTLATQERVDLSKIVAVNMATAHPHFESDGTMYNIGSSFKGGPHICIIKAHPADKMSDDSSHAFDKATVIASIRGQFKVCPCYHHSFAMTENYIVVMEQPFYINPLKFMALKLINQPLVDCFGFSPDITTKIHVIRKDTGEVLKQSYTSPAQVVFHHINAYEEDDQIVMDVVDVVDPLTAVDANIETLKKSDGRTAHLAEPKRFVLPLTVNKDSKVGENLVTVDSSATAILQDGGSIHCVSELLCSPGFDLPTINYRNNNGKKYRYFYAAGVFSHGRFQNAVLKCDIKTKEVKTCKISDQAFISEPIFIPAPNAIEEDDGVVLCGVSDVTPNNPDFLLFLDGKTFKEIARATIPDNVRLPYGLHGQFI